MNIIYFERINSTQKYLLENLDKYKLPVCIWSDYQTDGIGSRGNRWIGKKGNLFFSFAYLLNLFENVPLQSFSIYFGWIFKKTLNDFGSCAVLKWPNDIYLINKEPLKIGGVITNLKKDVVVCGIGLNTKFSPSDKFGCLDIEVKNDKILQNFFIRLEQKPNFDEVIEEYKKEFEKTKKIFGIEGELDKDGALMKNKKKVYSRR
ncbi:MAG: biotin--[acetyl-CoA-carboxylase] ligase [Nautiliaceae bacterium]